MMSDECTGGFAMGIVVEGEEFMPIRNDSSGADGAKRKEANF